jgi:MFS transporter, ACS family, hexuronate transporter
MMESEHGYSESFTRTFTSVWYVGTDVGCILSGAMALWLARSGWTIKYSRVASFGACACLCALLTIVPGLDRGPLLLAIFLIVGAGALGMFPIFYSFSQDISRQHQGKVTGITGAIGWGLSSPTQSLFGYLKDKTGSYDMGIMLIGILPLTALLFILLLWPKDSLHEG